mgnify:CR=1 FL=1
MQTLVDHRPLWRPHSVSLHRDLDGRVEDAHEIGQRRHLLHVEHLQRRVVIAVGGLLGAVAVFVINKNIKFLGQTPALRTDAVVAMLRADNMVLSVQDVKSVMVSPQVARFKAEIHFNPQLLSDKYLSAHNNLARGLRDAQDDDWVVFGDLDELPGGVG